MRFAALIIVIAIIYVTFTHWNPADSATEAMKEADAVTQTEEMEVRAQLASPSSSLRAPIDRTRAMLEKVRRRNGDKEF